jgi:hypothetical protein
MKTPAPQRAAGRRKLAAKGQALADGSEPIPDLAYLKKAIRSVGRLDPSKRPALKALIRKRARELGALNAAGVKNTWAFANDDGQAIEMATMTGKMPRVRGAADVTVTRSGPGSVTVMHKSTGTKVGTLDKGKAGWQATHRTGKKMEPAPTMAGSLNSLIGAHNKLAAGQPATADMAGDGAAVDLATSAATSSDGPRVTAMGGAGKAKAAAPATGSVPAEVQTVYKKLIAKGLTPKQAMAFAKRAAAMHAKDAAKKAA